MAVQAQYASNVLLFNRNGQELNDHSFQQQPGGFFDQSHMFFNNGATNPRKRGREVETPSTGITAPLNTYTMQQQTQPLRLIDLSQLHNQPQQNVVSTGLRLSFGDQQQQQLQQNHHYQQQQQNLACQSPGGGGGGLLSSVSEDLKMQIRRQRDEVDQFLQAQGEQLRRTLAERQQRHYRVLLGAAEESITRRLREKDAEVEKATRRSAELEARTTQLSVEAQVWQAKARAQEATAASLQAQLQQAIMSGGVAQDGRRGEDGTGCAGGVEGQAEDAESAYIDPDRITLSGPSCKACRNRIASVVLLPCRHLCLCTDCDKVAHVCPLCLSVRNSSVEVFLF